jgi:hypothetical protein
MTTVNTAPGHFDRKQYQAVSVARPSELLNVPEVRRLVKRLYSRLILGVAPAIDFAGALPLQRAGKRALGPRLGRVKGSLRRCAPLTRPARSP